MELMLKTVNCQIDAGREMYDKETYKTSINAPFHLSQNQLASLLRVNASN
jgi:hypothetical protein